ncbi:MAG TPA: biotin--[acetyl-CoA-carboxylase] ligase [Bacillota bacterium]|nr:biotin--[acetyl-CoA-carboxylase] ligase [Bacillota bacterium]
MKSVLDVLKANQGHYVSGESLATMSGLTRAAIWKQINQLRDLGYKIDSSPRKGYCLVMATQVLHPFEIQEGLKTQRIGRTIHYRDTVDSTNILAKTLAKEGAPDGTLVIAEEQTAGRGRLGRTWSSVKGKGLWSSLILRPQIATSAIAGITVLTAVSMARAIFETTGIQVQVKWPNDLLYEGRKLAGILAELHGEMDRIHFLIVGVGLNVNQLHDEFPEELADRATSLRMIRGEILDRKLILQRYLEQFERAYHQMTDGNLQDVMAYAREHSATLGKWVTIRSGFGQGLMGEALALDDDGSLWIRDTTGKEVKVFSGEIIEEMEENP